MKITCDIQKVCEFYKKYPQYKGSISVNTPYGLKPIIEAKKVETNSQAYEIKTSNYNLICSPFHRIMSDTWIFAKDLSVGSKIQTITGYEEIIESKYLDEKLDLYDIQVKDVEQYYSNGILSHNSGFFEAITFSLFGRTNRSVTKDRIINWKNRKECQTEVVFKIGRDLFKVRRGIKPDYLEIYKNGKIIIQPPDVRHYQKILENEILKIDYHLFCTLVYVNLNNYTPFLQMDSTRKRIFVEKMFGLEMFSELNKLSNEKLTIIEAKLAGHKTEKAIKDNLKSDLQSRTQGLSLQLVGIKSSQKSLDSILKKLEEIKNPEDDYNFAVEELEKVNEQCIHANNKITEHNNNVLFFQEEKSKLVKQIETKETEFKKHKEDRKKYADIKKEYEGIDKKIEKEKGKKSDIQKKVDSLLEKIHSLEIKLAEKNIHYSQLSKNLDDLSGKSTCPLCRSKIDKDLLPNMQDDMKEHGNEIEKIKEDIKLKSEKMKELKSNVSTLENSIQILVSNKKEYDDALLKLENINAIISTADKTLASLHISLLDFDGKIKLNKELLEKWQKEYKKEEKYKNSQKILVGEKKEKLDKYNSLLHEKAVLEERVIWEDDTKKDLKKQIKENNKQLDKLEGECQELDDVCKKLTSLSDYMNYIKILCKDENAKQYAISFIMPHLEKNINHYLAKSELNYYINISNIMDEEIKGPGVYNAGYGNLSGGESKSIDLAILFALLDISRLQLGVFPNILLLDELLDTSVDKVGIDNLLKIILQRQKDDNSTIFIVTHRQDFEEMNGQRVYRVEKNIDGFSAIGEINI